MKRQVLVFLMFLILATLWVCTSGCATTFPMKIAMARAGTDIAVTQMLEWKVMTSDDAVLLVHNLRGALDEAENIPEYMAEVHAVTAPYVGGKLLAKFLLKTLPAYAFKIESYRYGLTQALNQAELSAIEHPKAIEAAKATGASP